MAQPTQSQVHLDAILTNISVAYIQNEANFIAGRVFPTVQVEKQSDKYYVYTKNDWFRDEMQVRPDGTESAGSGYGLSTASYSADVWGLHKDIGDQTRKNADNPLNMDRDAVQFLTQRGLLRREIQWVTDYFTTSVWGTDKTGGANGGGGDFTYWSDYTNSDPIEDIEAGKETVLGRTGFLPNTLVLGYQAFRKLKFHPDIKDNFKYTSAENITGPMMASFFEVQNVYVAKAIKATNTEGETAAYSFTHGKNAWLGYVNPTPGLLAPSAGYVFSWTGVSGNMGAEAGISRFRMDHLKADRIEIEMAWDNKVVATDLGYFFSGCVA
jgi:hypothetical protein